MEPLASDYRHYSIERLIREYLMETQRIDERNRKQSQKLIKDEILDRARRIVKFLEDEKHIEYDLKNRTIDEEVESVMRWIVGIGG